MLSRFPRFKMLRSTQVVSALGVAVLGMAGCGGGELTASSSCHDYMQANANDKSAAVARVAEERRISGASGPLGMSNIDYICGGNPNTTLGDAVAGSGSQQSAPPEVLGTPEPGGAEATPAPPPAVAFKERGNTYKVAYAGGFGYQTEGVRPPYRDLHATFRFTNTSDRSMPTPVPQPQAEIRKSALGGDCPEVDDPNDPQPQPHSDSYCAFVMSSYGVSAQQLGRGEAADIEYASVRGLKVEPDIEDVRFYYDGKRIPGACQAG